MQQPIILHVLLHAESPSDLSTAATTLNSIRVGFPSAANINVYTTYRSRHTFSESNISDQWPLLSLGELDSISAMRSEHSFFLNELIWGAFFPDAIHICLDGDLIFLDNIETSIRALLSANPDTLLMGQHIKEAYRCGMNWMERFHTHMLVFPNLTKLRSLITDNPYVTPWTPCNLIPPQLVFERGTPVFYDTAANLFHMLRTWNFKHLVNFTPHMHARYVHLTCGGSMSILKNRFTPEAYESLVKRHALALKDPTQLASTNNSYNEYMFDNMQPLSNKTELSDN